MLKAIKVDFILVLFNALDLFILMNSYMMVT